MGDLLALIKGIVETNGPLTVAGYMELALQHPEFGYYRKKEAIGHDGDFITAPEISQMFGEMLGLWCADLWRRMGSPEKFALLELGPGRGTLMQDALRASAKIPGFHQAMQLYLAETNAALRKLQEEKLAEHLPVYIGDISELPPLPLIAVANEFFDALPIRQFEKTFQGWCERMVTFENGKLAFMMKPLDPMFMQMIPSQFAEANPGTVYEACLPGMALARNLAQHIVRHGGVMLVIDYGYAEPSGAPTLQAVSNHQFASVLTRPGEVDLTAHVDFGRLRSIAHGQNAAISGPVGQGEFLQSLGIELRAVQLKQRATPQQAKDIDSALQRLIDPSQMGVLFKVMAIASPQLNDLDGF